MGIGFSIQEGIGPVIQNPVRSIAHVEALKDTNIKESVPFVLDSIKTAIEKLNGRVPLIGFSGGGPFTLACYIIECKPSRDFLGVKNIMHNETEVWELLMEKLTKMVSEYL